MGQCLCAGRQVDNGLTLLAVELHSSISDPSSARVPVMLLQAEVRSVTKLIRVLKVTPSMQVGRHRKPGD